MADNIEVPTISDILRSRRRALGVTELCGLLDVRKTYIYDHVADGTIPAKRLPGGVIKFDPVTIAAWWDERSA